MSEKFTSNRLVVLDTETTGLDPATGHRIIEIGCVELKERRLTGNNLHLYLQPDRPIDPGAQEVHGISSEFLSDKPRFAQIHDQLHEYLEGAELIIHNAPFDVGFIEHEFRLLGKARKLSSMCKVTDTLAMARKQFPGQRNSLDALCKRLGVNNGHRTLHGALLDSEILADVYLVMTGGQTALSLDADSGGSDQEGGGRRSIDTTGLRVVAPVAEELAAHEAWLARLASDAPDGCAWRRLSEPVPPEPCPVPNPDP